MSQSDQIGISQFLNDFPEMAILSDNSREIILEGDLFFRLIIDDIGDITDKFHLRLCISKYFPREIPKIEEIGKKIPRNGNFHVNGDGSLCLGSPFRIISIIHQYPSLSGYVEKCLIPYLFAVSFKLRKGGDFIFGDLDHGDDGLYDEYLNLLGLEEDDQVKYAVNLLGLKKRIANKKSCPCGCGKRLGACVFHYKLNEYRKMAPPSWFRRNAYL